MKTAAHPFASTVKLSRRLRAKPASFTPCRRWPGSFPASRGCRCRCASCWNRCCATATARRSRPSMWRSWPTGAQAETAPTRSRSWWRAWCCRTSPACRCWPTSPPCAARPRAWARTPRRIEPLVPVDLVVDHSVMVDYYGTKNALDLNMKLEFKRNRERYEFMKWGMQAFDTFGVVPPGFGIVHQVNLEYLARGVHKTQRRCLLPRHPGRHRQPHHHDQRHRRGRLGRGRHRGRGRHAGPAGVFPDARRGRRGADRAAARRRDRHRPGADRDRDAAQAQGGGQVRRVFRRRHAHAGRAGPRHASATWRPNTAPPWASSRWTRRPSNTSTAPAAPRTRSRPSRPTSRRRACSACPDRARSITRRWSGSIWATVTPSLAGPKRPQDRIELGKVASQFATLFSKPNAENGFNQPRRPAGHALPGARDGPDARMAPRWHRRCTLAARRATWRRWC